MALHKARAAFESLQQPVIVEDAGVELAAFGGSHLATLSKGVALLEEPECFQHPRSLSELVRVILVSIEQGAQVILSTHSIELFDFLIAEAKARDQLAKVGLFRMALKEGVLKSTCLAGPLAASLRNEVYEDLRL